MLKPYAAFRFNLKNTRMVLFYSGRLASTGKYCLDEGVVVPRSELVTYQVGTFLSLSLHSGSSMVMNSRADELAGTSQNHRLGLPVGEPLCEGNRTHD